MIIMMVIIIFIVGPKPNIGGFFNMLVKCQSLIDLVLNGIYAQKGYQMPLKGNLLQAGWFFYNKHSFI